MFSLEYYEAGHRGETIYIKEIAGEAVRLIMIIYAHPSCNAGKRSRSFKARWRVHFLSVRSIMRLFFKYGYLLFITLERCFLIPRYFQSASPKYSNKPTLASLILKKAEAQAREAKLRQLVEENPSQDHGVCKA